MKRFNEESLSLNLNIYLYILYIITYVLNSLHYNFNKLGRCLLPIYKVKYYFSTKLHIKKINILLNLRLDFELCYYYDGAIYDNT